MKHLPNILTLSNLFCGCIAIAYILSSSPYSTQMPDGQYWITGTTQACMGALFIGIAAICDVLDGAAARMLGINNPLGKDLDSLADVVSFGVAPSMIMMQMLWAAWMNHPEAMDISMLAVSPAFLIACFGAYRLARFNNSPTNLSGFTGVPIPAVGLIIASFPFISYYNTLNLGAVFQKVWVLLLIIITLSLLMVSKMQLFSLKIKSFDLKANWGRWLWVLASVVLIPFLKFAAIPISFLLYILISLIYKPNTQVS